MSKNDWVVAGQQPAFPTAYDGNIAPELEVPGMTLRDYFAAKAMQAFARNACALSIAGVEVHPTDHAHVAKVAYELADAMLKAREE